MDQPSDRERVEHRRFGTDAAPELLMPEQQRELAGPKRIMNELRDAPRSWSWLRTEVDVTSDDMNLLLELGFVERRRGGAEWALTDAGRAELRLPSAAAALYDQRQIRGREQPGKLYGDVVRPTRDQAYSVVVHALNLVGARGSHYGAEAVVDELVARGWLNTPTAPADLIDGRELYSQWCEAMRRQWTTAELRFIVQTDQPASPPVDFAFKTPAEQQAWETLAIAGSQDLSVTDYLEAIDAERTLEAAPAVDGTSPTDSISSDEFARGWEALGLHINSGRRA